MRKSRICVGVVFGGKSGEHDVSIQSAKTVLAALKEGINEKVYKLFPIYIDLEGRWWGPPLAKEVLRNGSALSNKDLPQPIPPQGFRSFPEGHEAIDIWYPVIHGPNGEDGTIQGLFKLTGKPFIGPGVLASALGMDKIAMKAAFYSEGIPQVKYISLESKELTSDHLQQNLINRIESKIKYPYFVKPANLGSSVGISKVGNKKELINGLIKASKLDKRIIVEEGIIARELECAILGHNEIKISEVGEINIQSDWYDYEAKYLKSKNITIIPAKIPMKVKKRVQDLTLKACNAISAKGLARVDFFYDEKNDDVLINEINTLPGFTMQSMYPSLWEASGIPLPKLVSHLIETAQN